MSDDCVIREGTIIYPNVEYGKGFQTGHFVLIREGVRIGDHVSVGSFTELGPHVRLGNDVRIHSRVFIPEHTLIDDHVWLGPGVIITNTPHPLCDHAKQCLKVNRVMICQGAIIGAGALIMPGVTIGVDAVVGAGSVVLSDVERGSCVVGSPARRHVRETRWQLECTLSPTAREIMEVPDDFRPYSVT